jgi:hypothetical protein
MEFFFAAVATAVEVGFDLVFSWIHMLQAREFYSNLYCLAKCYRVFLQQKHVYSYGVRFGVLSFF